MNEIKVYIHDNQNIESSSKILKLLKDCKLDFATEVFGHFKSDEEAYIANVVGEKVKKLPHVVIDGERVGGYYDLVEYLMKKNIINYAGEPTWKMKN